MAHQMLERAMVNVINVIYVSAGDAMRTFAVVALISLLGTPMWAQLADPANLFIGDGLNGSYPTGGGGFYNGELTENDGNLSIFFHSDGKNKGPLDTPLLLVLAVPNDTGAGMFSLKGAANIISTNFYSAYPAPTPVTALNVDFGGFGLPGYTLMASNALPQNKPNPDPYGTLDVVGDNSFNFNSMFDIAVGSGLFSGTINNFGIYVFSLSAAGFDVGGLIDIVMDTSDVNGIPYGTFALAWGCNNDHITDARDCRPSDTFTTPLTQGGIVGGTPAVPEPTSIILLGTVMIGAAMMWRKKPAR